jgi:hypothetical protein
MLAALLVVTTLVGCHDGSDGPIAAASISDNGFARDGEAMRALDGTEMTVWGFVDHGNLSGDEAAREILGEWWSGDGPDADTWSFHLKARPDDEIGHSFAVRIPDDEGRDELLRAFVADARAQRPTRVVVTGTLHTFDAPSQTTTRTGLVLVLQSSRGVSLELPGGR